MENNMALLVKKPLSKFQYILLYFFTYAFIGWVLETFYAVYELGHFTKRGFLLGPICPIYGYGAVILLMFLSKYKDNSFKLFFFSAIVFSLFEYVAGFALDALFAAKWWDYSNEFFNLNGRISIFFSFVWGIIALIFINHVHPFIKRKLEKLLDKIPYAFQTYLIRFFFLIFITDTILSSIKYLSQI